MRYTVEEEVTKNGRKKEVQYAIHDHSKDDVVFRGSDKVEVEFICDQMNERLKEAKVFGTGEFFG